jgi:hypothetical protein
MINVVLRTGLMAWCALVVLLVVIKLQPRFNRGIDGWSSVLLDLLGISYSYLIFVIFYNKYIIHEECALNIVIRAQKAIQTSETDFVNLSDNSEELSDISANPSLAELKQSIKILKYSSKHMNLECSDYPVADQSAP